MAYYCEVKIEEEKVFCQGMEKMISFLYLVHVGNTPRERTCLHFYDYNTNFKKYFILLK